MVGDSFAPCKGHVALQKKANGTSRNAYANLSRSFLLHSFPKVLC